MSTMRSSSGRQRAISIGQVDTDAGLSELGDQWDSLLARSATKGFFLCWDFISVWWKHYGAGKKLSLLTAHQGGELIGIAPLAIVAGQGRLKQPFRYLTFLGCNEVFPEYSDFIIARGREAEVVPAFCERLALSAGTHWDAALLERISGDSPNLPLIEQELSARKMVVARLQDLECPRTTLASSWDEFVKTKSKNFRKQARQREKRLAKLGEVRLQFAGEDGLSCDQAFDLLLDLNRERWAEEAESFTNPINIAFHRELIDRLHQADQLVLCVMWVGEVAVAAEYDFIYDDVVWGYQAGWRMDWADRRVAAATIKKVLEWAMEQGYREYDFLAGASEYKASWCDSSRMCYDIGVFPATIRGRLLDAGRRLKILLKDTLPEQRIDRLRELAERFRLK